MARNFAHDSAMERQELKKAFIHLLMSEHLPAGCPRRARS